MYIDRDSLNKTLTWKLVDLIFINIQKQTLLILGSFCASETVVISFRTSNQPTNDGLLTPIPQHSVLSYHCYYYSFCYYYHFLIEFSVHNSGWTILDARRGVDKLMTTEAIYINKLRLQRSMCDIYLERKLTLKYLFTPKLN